MASVMDQYGITIETDPLSGAQSIPVWQDATALALTWAIDGTASDQLITNQAQAIQVLNQASANMTPHRLINAYLINQLS